MQNRQGKTGQDGDESFVEVFPVTPCRCGDSFFSQFCGMLDQNCGIDDPMVRLAVGEEDDQVTVDRVDSGQAAAGSERVDWSTGQVVDWEEQKAAEATRRGGEREIGRPDE